MKLTERLAALRGHDDHTPPEAAHEDPSPRSAPERLRSDAITADIDPFDADPSEARVHITADAELIIDLRPAAVVGGPATTTDMACPNCAGALRVDSLDAVSHHATMSCGDCGFHFSKRLTARRH